MPTKKKLRTRGPERLDWKPLNPLDAKVLELKNRSRLTALDTTGHDVKAALSGPPVHEMPPFPASSDDESMRGIGDELPHNEQGQNAVVDQNLIDMANALNDGFYSGRRMHEEAQWRTQFPAMFPTYLKYKEKTREWSGDLFDHDVKAVCACPSEPRAVEIMDLTCGKQCILIYLQRDC